jgi:hypothetical protein
MRIRTIGTDFSVLVIPFGKIAGDPTSSGCNSPRSPAVPQQVVPIGTSTSSARWPAICDRPCDAYLSVNRTCEMELEMDFLSKLSSIG